jgi:hypothetical protein
MLRNHHHAQDPTFGLSRECCEIQTGVYIESLEEHNVVEWLSVSYSGSRAIKNGMGRSWCHSSSSLAFTTNV